MEVGSVGMVSIIVLYVQCGCGCGCCCGCIFISLTFRSRSGIDKVSIPPLQICELSGAKNIIAKVKIQSAFLQVVRV